MPIRTLGLLAMLCVLFPAAGRAQDTGPVMGSYECWFFSSPRMGLNFTLEPGGKYRDVEDKHGTYSFNARTKELAFKGGALDGETVLYEVRKGTPTASFRRRGSEVAFCEAQKQ